MHTLTLCNLNHFEYFSNISIYYSIKIRLSDKYRKEVLAVQMLQSKVKNNVLGLVLHSGAEVKD